MSWALSSLGTERGAKFLVGDYGLGSERDYSDSTAEIIDQEIKENPFG